MNRRSFLRGLLASSAAVAVAPIAEPLAAVLSPGVYSYREVYAVLHPSMYADLSRLTREAFAPHLLKHAQLYPIAPLRFSKPFD